MTARNRGWRELGASTLLHGSAGALVLVLSAGGSGGMPRNGASAGATGSLGPGSRVVSVALLGPFVAKPSDGASRGGKAAGSGSMVAGDAGEEAAPAPRPRVSLRVDEPRATARGAVGPSPTSDGAARTIAAAAKEAAAPATARAGAGGEGKWEGVAVPVATAPDGGADPAASAGAGLPAAGGAPEAGSAAAAGVGEAGDLGPAGGAGLSTPGGADVEDEVEPVPLHLAVPALPRQVSRERARGAKAKLMIYVTESGDVREVRLLSGTGTDALDAAAVRAAYRMRYRPGSRGGAPAAMWTQAEVLF